MTTHTKALLITVFGIILMSFESLLVKTSSVSTLTFSFYIFLFLIISTNITLYGKYKRNYLFVFKQNMPMLLFCGFLFTTSNLLFIASIKNTTVANASLIFSSAPIFSALYMYLLYKQKSEKNIYISSFFIFIGLFVIFSSHINSEGMVGNLYAFLCVLCYSLSFVLLSKYKNFDLFALFCLSGIFGSIATFFLSENINIGIKDLYLVLLAGLIIVPVSRILVGKGTRTLEATEVSLLLVLETVLAPFLVWIFLKEVPSSSTFIGGTIILVTLIFNSLFTIKVQKKKSVTEIVKF